MAVSALATPQPRTSGLINTSNLSVISLSFYTTITRISMDDPYQVDSESDSDESVAPQQPAVAMEMAAPVEQDVLDSKPAGEKKKKKPFWAPKHIAYVKGLPFAADQEEYTRMFNECGETVSITEQLDDEQRWTGCLFVRYATEEGLKNCIAVWNEAIWTGAGGNNERFIKVQRHNEKKAAKKKKSNTPAVKDPASSKAKIKESSRKRPTATTFKVVVSNLHKKITDDEIRGAFSSCGDIKSLKTSREKTNSADCKGYCHIEYTSQEGLDAALNANFKTRLKGLVVAVRIPGASRSEVPLVDIGVPITKPKTEAPGGALKSSGKRKRSEEA